MAIGDLVAIDSLEFDTSQGSRVSSILHIAGDVYAIAYRGPGYDGWLKTFDIDSEGDIEPVIDSLEFAPDTTIYQSEIRHVAGDIYAIAYADYGNGEGRIVTVEIDSAGNIRDTLVDGPNAFSTSIGYDLDFIKVASGMFAVVHYGTGGSYVRSIGIADDGTIDATETDSLEFDEGSAVGDGFNIIHVAGDFFAIAYEGYGTGVPLRDSLMLKTVEISSAGIIPPAVTDSLELEQQRNLPFPSICHVSGDIYAIAYSRAGNGWLKTVSIDSSGNIDAAAVDTQEFETDACLNASLVHVASDLFAIAYRCSSDFGRISTIEIDSAGTIGTILDSLSFGTGLLSHAYWPRLVVIDTEVLAVAYHDYFSDGRVETMGVIVPPAVGLPMVTTDSATALSAIAATPNGTLDDDGGEACDCGFQWGLDTGYGTTTPTESKTTGETFSQVIGGLFPGTTYHFRAFATNSVGTGHGADRSFTTALVISRAYALARREL